MSRPKSSDAFAFCGGRCEDEGLSSCGDSMRAVSGQDSDSLKNNV